MPQKNNLRNKMITGLTVGAVLAHCSVNGAASNEYPNLMQLAAESGGNITYHLMTADELMLELTNDGAKVFNTLSPEGQKLALKIASRSCDGTNDCKGQNACQTKNNQCAGKGQCKGTTKCAVGDKNLAVRLAAKIMAEKREGLDGKSLDAATKSVNAKDTKTAT